MLRLWLHYDNKISVPFIVSHVSCPKLMLIQHHKLFEQFDQEVIYVCEI